MRIVVTGASGRLGRSVVECLLNKNITVVGIDKRPSPSTQLVLDLCDIEPLFEAMQGADAIIHLGAIPSPGGLPAEVVYRNNTLGTFHVFEVATQLNIRRVVFASSVSALGFPFQHRWSEPLYFPIDEEHPLIPQDAYGLSKAVGEEIAAAYCRRGAGSAASLRISTIVDVHDLDGHFSSVRDYPEHWASSLWSYVEVRDVANACYLAATVPFDGHLPVFITAAETLSELPTNELLDRWFPSVPRREQFVQKHWSLLKGQRAYETLGYRPQYCWEHMRNELNQA